MSGRGSGGIFEDNYREGERKNVRNMKRKDICVS